MKSSSSNKKTEIDKILMANCYLLKCKLNGDCKKADLAQKYLTILITESLTNCLKNGDKKNTIIF